jgi:magnesium-transporting ATPase (P-type)
VKGAPERVLRVCNAARRRDDVVPLDAGHWQSMRGLLAGDGQRVLAFAVLSAPPGKRDLAFSDLENGATLLGLGETPWAVAGSDFTCTEVAGASAALRRRAASEVG